MKTGTSCTGSGASSGFTNRVEIAENDTRRVSPTECAAVRIHAYTVASFGLRAGEARQMLAKSRTVAIRAEAINLRAKQAINFAPGRADALNILCAELANRDIAS